MDRWTDKKHQSDWILGKGGDRICGSTGESCNPMKLPRALRTRFARPKRPGRQEIDGYQKVREKERLDSIDVRNRWKMEGWVESYWNQDSPAHSPLVPEDGTDHQQCQQQQQKHWDNNGGSTCEGANKHEQKGIKCMFYWQDSLWTVWLTTTGRGSIHRSCCNFTSVSHPSHRTPGHTKSQGYKVCVCVYIPNPLYRHFNAFISA